MEITEQKSQEIAEKIIILSTLFIDSDAEYLKAASKAMMEQANAQDTLIILNPSHNATKNRLLQLQGKALLHLADFVSCNVEVGKMKLEIDSQDQNTEKIKKLFI